MKTLVQVIFLKNLNIVILNSVSIKNIIKNGVCVFCHEKTEL